MTVSELFNCKVPVVTIQNLKTNSCKDNRNWLNFVIEFDLLKVFSRLTEEETQTLTHFGMCLSKALSAVHVLQLKPTQLVWCGVVWCSVVWCGAVWYGVVCVWCCVVWCSVV